MKFYVLGSLRFSVGDAAPITPTGTRDRVFLGELLVHAGHVVSIDHVAEAMWADRPPANRANAVHVRVSRLRSLFRSMAGRTDVAGVLSTGPGAYRLTPEEIDAAQFEQLLAAGVREYEKGFLDSAAVRLERALRLWKGEAFADVAAGQCVAAEGRRLTELRLVASERQAEVLLALGAHTQVVNTLKPLVEQHPLRETLHGHLMTALHHSGRTAEALTVFAQLRSTLAEELGTEPTTHLRALHGSLLEDSAEGPPKTTSSYQLSDTAVGWSSPCQLPRRTPDFVPVESTDTVLRALTAQARTSPAVTAITGQGGAGKTTAAVHLAHDLRSSFPDGQLFVELGGSTRTPVDPAEALAQMLSALGRPRAGLPDGLEARAACFRDRLKGRRVLTVLDDAADEAQIRNLLPGNAESAVLVTSRAWLTGMPFTARAEHNHMSPHQSVRLFHRVAGADRTSESTAVQEVARLCGYLPLALRIAGARLAARPHWNVADLARRLGDSRKKLLDELTHGPLSIRSCFTATYEGLSPNEQWLFQELGAYGAGVFAASAVANLLNHAHGDITEELERLTEARLLTVVHMTGQRSPSLFRLHTLAASYAKERIEVESGLGLGRLHGGKGKERSFLEDTAAERASG
ncbi:transcriptional regulator (plasmid) [Streptomyces sp. NBC_00715]|uniref:AfsR/SARP family transcriptional regulator n=1 Tax=Streptomyces sp. NBC_00715 TaxID=2975811 RepID=UPI003870C7A3